MKHLLLTLCFFSLLHNANAQFEIKSNPVALLFEVGVLSLEYSNLRDWGGQLDLYGFEGFGFATFSGKYYLNPKYGADRFHVGGFLGSVFEEDGGVGIGFLTGYKVMSSKRFIFEAGLGVGRLFAGDNDDFEIFPYFNLNIGYRFLEARHRGR